VQCISVPVPVGATSAVAVAAYKRWLLAHLLAPPAETEHACGRAGGLGAVDRWEGALVAAGVGDNVGQPGGAGGYSPHHGGSAVAVGLPALPRWGPPATASAVTAHAGSYVLLAQAFHAHATAALPGLSGHAVGATAAAAAAASSGGLAVHGPGPAAAQRASSATSTPTTAAAAAAAGAPPMVAESGGRPGGGSGVHHSILAARLAGGAAEWEADGTLPLVARVAQAARAQRVARLSRVYATLPTSLAAHAMSTGGVVGAAGEFASSLADVTSQLQEMVRAGARAGVRACVRACGRIAAGGLHARAYARARALLVHTHAR
jgi:hypothetical protein